MASQRRSQPVGSAPAEWLDGLSKAQGYAQFRDTAVRVTDLLLARGQAIRRQADALERLASGEAPA